MKYHKISIGQITGIRIITRFIANARIVLWIVFVPLVLVLLLLAFNNGGQF